MESLKLRQAVAAFNQCRSAEELKIAFDLLGIDANGFDIAYGKEVFEKFPEVFYAAIGKPIDSFAAIEFGDKTHWSMPLPSSISILGPLHMMIIVNNRTIGLDYSNFPSMLNVKYAVAMDALEELNKCR